MKILVGNAQSQVIGCEPDRFEAIRTLLSYEVQGSQFAVAMNPYWDGRVKLIDARGNFPTGLLARLIVFLREHVWAYEIVDQRFRPSPSIPITLVSGHSPRDYQAEARDTTRKFPRGVFVMGTGAGKSFTSALVIEEKKVQTLVVTPDTGLREQLFADYDRWFPGLVSKDVTSLLPIVVANIQSLANKKPKFFTRFEMLMIDEFHHSAASTYKKINKYCNGAFFRYGFTGTFVRPDGADMEMFGVLANVIYRKSTSWLIENGYLVRPEITIKRYQMSETNPRTGKPKKIRVNYQKGYQMLTEDENFNALIANIAREKSEQEGKQTLIIVRRIEHGKKLAALLPDAVYLSGNDPMKHREQVKKDFINKKLRCLVATNIFGEGIDIPSIDVLINARCQKTEIQTSQGIGRALRKYPGKTKAEVFDFLIVGQKHLEDHSVQRIRTYQRERAFKIRITR